MCGVNVKESRGESAFFDEDKSEGVPRILGCSSQIEIKSQEEPTAENPF